MSAVVIFLSNDLLTPSFGVFMTRPLGRVRSRLSQTIHVWHHAQYYSVPFLCLQQPLLLRCTCCHDPLQLARIP